MILGSVKTFQNISFECFYTSVLKIELMLFMHSLQERERSRDLFYNQTIFQTLENPLKIQIIL